MAYSFQDFLGYMKAYEASSSYLTGFEIEITDPSTGATGEVNLPPLLALRLYQAERTIDTASQLAQSLCMNRSVTITKDGKEVLQFVYGGGDISQRFESVPWLLDTFFNMCWGLLIKKLTPPSLITPAASSKRDSEEEAPAHLNPPFKRN